MKEILLYTRSRDKRMMILIKLCVQVHDKNSKEDITEKVGDIVEV